MTLRRHLGSFGITAPQICSAGRYQNLHYQHIKTNTIQFYAHDINATYFTQTRCRTFVNGWRKNTEEERKRDHCTNTVMRTLKKKKHQSTTSPTPPMLTCVVLKVQVKQHKRSCHWTSHTSKYGLETERKQGGWVGGGGGGTYVLHLSVEECAWG